MERETEDIDDDKKREIVEKMLKDARENDADNAVVIDVPTRVIEENGGMVGEAYNRRIDSTLFAGPVVEETEEEMVLSMPCRIGEEKDFSQDLRKKLGPEGVYGFRDATLDKIKLEKSEIEVYRE